MSSGRRPRNALIDSAGLLGKSHQVGARSQKLVRDDHHSLQLRCIRTLYDTPPPRCGAGRCLPAQRGTPMRRSGSSLKQEGALEDMLHCCQQLMFKSNQEGKKELRRRDQRMSERKPHHDHFLGAERSPQGLEARPSHLELGASGKKNACFLTLDNSC